MTRRAPPSLGPALLALSWASACLLPPVDATGRACDVDGACAPGFTCVAGGCELVCAAAADCPDGRACLGGACLVVVALDAGIDDDEDAGAGDDDDDDDAGAPDENAAPVAAAGAAVVPGDAATEVVVSAEDDDGDALGVVIERAPAHGSATPRPAADAAAFTYAPDPGFAGFDTVAVRVTDGALVSEVVEVTIEVVGRSCAHVLNTGGSAGDGVYRVDVLPDDGVHAPAEVFCDMTNDAGGWSLALKVDGSATTFCYDAPLWSDDLLLNEGSVDESATEAKLVPYLAMPVEELRIAMDRIDDQAVPLTTGVLRVDESVAGVPLRELIALGQPQDTSFGNAEWEAFFPGDGDVLFDGAEGLNVERSDVSAVRIGQVGDVAGVELSSLGIGMRSGACIDGGLDLVTAGARVDPCCGLPPEPRPVLARVSVRSRDFTFLPAKVDCAAHLDAGRSLTGTYLVDPDGPGGAAPTPVSCALGDLRRLVAFEDGDPCPAPLVDNPDGPGCIRGVTGDVSLTFSSPVPFTRVRGRVEAIARGAPDGFLAAQASGINVNNVFVDGITVSAGLTRQHLFTFAVGTLDDSERACPCGGPNEPGFVGSRHICEDVVPGDAFVLDDPLFDFDAQDDACTPPETPNLFEVDAALTDLVEVRVMLDDDDAEDIALTRLELFVR